MFEAFQPKLESPGHLDSKAHVAEMQESVINDDATCIQIPLP